MKFIIYLLLFGLLMTSCNSSSMIKGETRYLYPDYIAYNQPQRMVASIKEGSIVISVNCKYVELKGEMFYEKFHIKMEVAEIIEQDSVMGSAAPYATTYKGRDMSEPNTKDILTIVEVPGKPIGVYFKAIQQTTKEEVSIGFMCKSSDYE